MTNPISNMSAARALRGVNIPRIIPKMAIEITVKNNPELISVLEP